MKRIISLLIILFLIVLAGCAKQYVCPDGTTVLDPNMCKKEEPKTIEIIEEPKKPIVEEIEEIEEKEEPKVIVKEIDQEIQEFIDKVNAYDNYEFRYTPADSAYSMEVAVKGDRLSYQFKDYTKQQDIDEFYDIVVLDLTQKTAYQYCESKTKCSDANREFTRQIDYEDRKIPTLQEVMDSLVITKIIGDEMMMQRSSKKVEYTDTDGISGTMWIDKFFGTPLRKEYTVGDREKTEIFDAFSKGGVTEGMVTVPGNLKVK